MKEKNYFLNIALTAVLCVALLVCILLWTFAPAVILPRLDIPNMVLLSLAALLLSRGPAFSDKGSYLVCFLLSGLSFGLLPYCAGFVSLPEAMKTALAGGIVFTVTTVLYASIQDRLSTGPDAKAAPIVSALGLYLAAQCFAGLL